MAGSRFVDTTNTSQWIRCYNENTNLSSPSLDGNLPAPLRSYGTAVVYTVCHWPCGLQMDYSYALTLFKSRSITSNLVLVHEFHLEAQTIVQAMLLLTKNTEQNLISRRQEETKEETQEEIDQASMGRARCCAEGEGEREEFLVLPWEKPCIREIYIRVLALKPNSLILFIKWNSLPAALSGFLLQHARW